MSVTTQTLSEFLLARIAEDETAAQVASPGGWQYGDVDSVAGGSLYDETRMIGSLHYEQPDDHDGSIVRHLLALEADANGAHIARHDPARVLAECAAKRRIVKRHPAVSGCCETCTDKMSHPRPSEWAAVRYPCPTLRDLAAVYADHPDYRDEWKP
jgi:hypothetical protein